MKYLKYIIVLIIGIILGTAPNAYAVAPTLTTSSGKVGVGTTTPFAKLSVNGVTGDTNAWLFSIASSTSQGTTTFQATTNQGALLLRGQAGTSGMVIKSQGTTSPIVWSASLPSSASNDIVGTSSAGIITSFTPNATSTVRASCYVTITAIVTDVIKCQATYTDETSTSRTQDFFPQGLTSQALSSTGAFIYPTMDLRVKANTLVTVQIVFTTGIGSITYDTGSDLEILR